MTAQLARASGHRYFCLKLGDLRGRKERVPWAPAAFIHVLFTGSLLTEVIFSLDGLGLLGFEAAINRDYPIMFGTLYFFGLVGLVMGIVGDFIYTVVDPRIDFEARG